MAFTTLISTDALGHHLDDPAFVIVDCRFRLDDEAWGQREYTSGHIPGAVYAHLDRDLSAPKTGTNGRHPLPQPGAMARTLGRLGITSGVQVVAYDQDTGTFASRLWWTLRWLGHDATAVLDGGFAKWQSEGRVTKGGDEQRPPREFAAAPRIGMATDAAGVARVMSRPDWRLIDARAPERYRGEAEPIDRLPGHIPGAANHFFQGNLDDRGTFRSSDDLRERFNAALGGIAPEHVICYCGSGVTACHNLLALERAGLTGAKLYPGSWSEWSSDPARPIETTALKSR